MFIAQSGLLSRQEAPNHTSEFGADSWAYELEPGQSELRVPLRWTSPDGLEVTKTFLFRADSYIDELEKSESNSQSIVDAHELYPWCVGSAGGCTDLFEAHADGSMHQQLDALGVAYDGSAEVDALGLLPGWLHPRQAS